MEIATEITDDMLAYWRSTFPDAVPVTFHPSAGADNCSPCETVVTAVPNGPTSEVLVVRVPWKPNEIELAHLARGGTLWLSSWGGLPPHMLEVQEP